MYCKNTASRPSQARARLIRMEHMLCLFLADTRFGNIAGFPPSHGSFRQDSMRGILPYPHISGCTRALQRKVISTSSS